MLWEKTSPAFGLTPSGTLSRSAGEGLYRVQRRVGGKGRGDALGEAFGEFALCHRRPILDRVGIHEVNRVAVAAEGAGAGRNVVGEDPVAALALALRARVGDDVLGLGGKADNELRAVVAA